MPLSSFLFTMGNLAAYASAKIDFIIPEALDESKTKIEDVDGNLAFEVVDLIKPEPMKGVSSEEVKLPEIKKDTKFIDGIRKGVLPLEKSKISSKVKSLPGS